MSRSGVRIPEVAPLITYTWSVIGLILTGPEHSRRARGGSSFFLLKKTVLTVFFSPLSAVLRVLSRPELYRRVEDDHLSGIRVTSWPQARRSNRNDGTITCPVPMRSIWYGVWSDYPNPPCITKSLPIMESRESHNPRKRGVSLPNKGARLCGTCPTADLPNIFSSDGCYPYGVPATCRP